MTRLALAIVVLAHASSARAYEPSGAVWSTLPVHYNVVSSSGAELGRTTTLDVVAASYASWAAPECTSYEATFDGEVSRADAGDGVSTIWWRYDEWPFELGGSSVIAVTTSIFRGSEMLDGDIVCNGVDHHWTTSPATIDDVDAQSIVTHEIGHQLGLQHSPDTSSTMYFVYPGFTSQRTLATDDVSGVCALYPSGSEPACLVDDDCAGGMVCRGAVCTAPGLGAFGEPCVVHGDCESSLCVSDPDDGIVFCAIPCASAADCPAESECVPLVGGGGGCGLPPPAGTASYGEPCLGGGDCASQLCLSDDSPPEGTCSQFCTDDTTCPAGAVCALLTSGSSGCVMGEAPSIDAGVVPDEDAGRTSDAGSIDEPDAGTDAGVSMPRSDGCGCRAAGAVHDTQLCVFVLIGLFIARTRSRRALARERRAR